MECQRELTMRKVSISLSVCPSVRLSVKRVHCGKMEERSVQIFIPCQRSFSLVFLRKKNGWCGRPILPEILGQRARVGAKSPILNRSHQSKARVSNREREGQVGLLHIFMKTFSNCNGESSRICRILHLFLSTSSHNIIDVDTMLNYHS